MINTNAIQDLVQRGGVVVGADGEKIGKIGQVYLDDSTGAPEWVTVHTGLFGTSESFVPLSEAQIDGDNLRVPFAKRVVKDAPRIDADGDLSPEQETELYRYYNLPVQGGSQRSGESVGTVSGESTRSDASAFGNDIPSDLDDPAEAGDHRPDLAGRPGIVGYDRSGPTTDEAMTRSEQQLRVGTQAREAGRARLRKHVVTETVTQTVPVSHEEARVVREPITDANRDAAMSGPALSEEEHEVVLHADRPVVDKDVVPVERVRLDTEQVTEQVSVSDQVAKEQIELDELDDPNRKRG